MPAINETQPTASEIVLTERRVSNEFRILEIHESITDRFVRVDVELGPFTTEEGPGGRTEIRGSGRRGVRVWSNEEYDAIRDTWTNVELLEAVKTKLS